MAKLVKLKLHNENPILVNPETICFAVNIFTDGRLTHVKVKFTNGQEADLKGSTDSLYKDLEKFLDI